MDEFLKNWEKKVEKRKVTQGFSPVSTGFSTGDVEIVEKGEDAPGLLVNLSFSAKKLHYFKKNSQKVLQSGKKCAILWYSEVYSRVESGFFQTRS